MNIADTIKQIARQGVEAYLTICTVDAIDKEARTIDCTPIDEGAPILGVNLQADQAQSIGVVLFPAVGSEVVVGFLSPAVAVVLLTTEISGAAITIGQAEVSADDPDGSVVIVTEKVKAHIKADSLKIDADGTTLEMNGTESVWNGGSETTANATNLKQELIKMSGRIDAIIQAISSSAVAPQDGGATYKANMAAALSSLTKENFSNMIDNKIKH